MNQGYKGGGHRTPPTPSGDGHKGAGRRNPTGHTATMGGMINMMKDKGLLQKSKKRK